MALENFDYPQSKNPEKEEQMLTMSAISYIAVSPRPT